MPRLLIVLTLPPDVTEQYRARLSAAFPEIEVEVAADTDAWLGIGSDDGLKIWLNGELVADHWTERTSKLDDVIVPLRLHAGKNQFLIKIQNVKGRWSFTGRLRVRGK